MKQTFSKKIREPMDNKACLSMSKKSSTKEQSTASYCIRLQ